MCISGFPVPTLSHLQVILALQKQILSTGALKEEQDARIARLGKELSESLSVRDELAIQSSG